MENLYSKLVKEVLINRFHFKNVLLKCSCCLQHVRIVASLSFSKTATALMNTLFSDINISQGSVVTRFRCDGIFNEVLLQISRRL